MFRWWWSTADWKTPTAIFSFSEWARGCGVQRPISRKSDLTGRSSTPGPWKSTSASCIEWCLLATTKCFCVRSRNRWSRFSIWKRKHVKHLLSKDRMKRPFALCYIKDKEQLIVGHRSMYFEAAPASTTPRSCKHHTTLLQAQHHAPASTTPRESIYALSHHVPLINYIYFVIAPIYPQLKCFSYLGTFIYVLPNMYRNSNSNSLKFEFVEIWIRRNRWLI